MRSILRSCDLEGAANHDSVTEKQSTAEQSRSSTDGLHASMKQYYAGRHCYFDDDGVFFHVSPWQGQQRASLSSLKLSCWLKEIALAAERARSSSKPARDALSEVAQQLCTEYGSTDVAITCGWSPAVTLGIVKGVKEVLDSVHDKEVSWCSAGRGRHGENVVWLVCVCCVGMWCVCVRMCACVYYMLVDIAQCYLCTCVYVYVWGVYWYIRVCACRYAIVSG